MAKVVFMELVESVSGKYCKQNPDSPIFQKRKTCNVVCHIHNPFTGPATAKQQEVQANFASAHAAVKSVMSDPSLLAEATAAWKANPGKYSTLRGFIFAQEYAKL